MGKIIRPGDLAPTNKPIIFISGTVRGSHGWLDDVEDVLGGRSNPLPVAINNFDDRVELHSRFKTKLAWGDHHIRQALKYGLVMFWFAKQTRRARSNQSIHYDHPYGANAMYELARCLEYRAHHPYTRIVVGCSDEYDRQNAVLERVELSKTRVKPVVGGLGDVLEETLRLVNQ